MDETLRIHKEHYRKVYKARHDKNFWIHRDEGMGNIPPIPRYCFATRQHLGEHGKLERHELYGKIVVRKETNEEFIIDSVNLHWYQGWYYFIVFIDKNKSSATGIYQNINSMDEFVQQGVARFNERYKILD